MTKSALLIIGLALAACDSGPDGNLSSIDMQIDTVDGVIHTTQSGAGAWATGTPWRADTSRAVEIGVVDGSAPYIFGKITGVMVARDGRIYVADGQAMEVRVFSPEGVFLTRFGREGDGPGEFRSITGLGRAPGNGVAVLDPMRYQVSTCSPEGAFQRSLHLDRQMIRLRAGEPVRFDSHGRYYDLSPLVAGLYVDSLGVARYDSAGTSADTTLLAVEKPADVQVMRGRVLRASLRIPFASRASAAVGPAGRAYATLGDEYYIAEFGASGDTLRTIRRVVEPVPISSAERDSAREDLVDRYTEIAGTAPRDVPAIPDHRPAIQLLEVDEIGDLWVLRGTADPAVMHWDVFDPDGDYLGVVTFPTMHVMHIGENTIAGVVRDEMDVERVRVIPIGRG